MDAHVTWQGGLTFEGTADTGFTVPLGGPAAAGGNDDGFRPMELFAVGLAGCTGMDVIGILRKKRQDITAFAVYVEAEKAEDHPHVFTALKIDYRITGRGVKPEAVERALELSRTKYCPAQAMLGQLVPIELTYTITEADD